MIFISILSYLFIMFVLYVCANQAAHTYRVSVNNGVSNPTFFSKGVVLFILFFTFAFGIRYNVGVDFMGYLEDYQSGYKLEYSKNELIYKNISLFWYNIGAHPIWFFSTYVFLQVSFFVSSIRKEIYLLPFLVVFLFGNGEVQTWMNIVRSSTAMCIWLLSLQYIEKRSFWKYLAFCLFAAGFHRTALLYIIIYPFFARDHLRIPSIPFQYLFILLSFVIRISFSVFSEYLAPLVVFVQTYLGGENDVYRSYDFAAMMEDLESTGSGTGIAFYVKLLIDLVIVYNCKRLLSFYPSKRFKIVYALFIIALFTFYCFPSNVISFSRPFRFFYVFRTLMLGYFAYYLLKERRKSGNQLLLFLVLSIYLGLFIMAQIVCNEDSCLWYQTWFNQ